MMIPLQGNVSCMTLYPVTSHFVTSFHDVIFRDVIFRDNTDFYNLIMIFSFRYSVENAYLEEKEDACNAVGEIAENTQ